MLVKLKYWNSTLHGHRVEEDMARACLILPIGVKREKVERILAASEVQRVQCIITVTIPGYLEEKKPLIEAAKYLAEMIGASYHEVVFEPRSPEGPLKLYKTLLDEKPSKVILAGVTGSRYLYPLLFQVLLMYWRVSGAEILLQHGVEGGDYSLEPLQGFASPAMRLSRVQQEILRLVYSSTEKLSGKTLIEKYGYTKSVYAVLADMERKGLLRVRRESIERTLPGMVLYMMLWG